MPLASAQLYLCTGARRGQQDFRDFIDAAYSGGVDIIQLRDKTIEAAEELELLSILRSVAEAHGKLWSVNDRADVAALSGAPVLHLGQKDLPAAAARKLMDDGAMLGLSTHSPEQAAAAARSELIDYFCAGPVWATPTKPGRAAVGLDLLRAAAGLDRETLEGGRQPKPWFAIGGIDLTTIGRAVDAGARRVVVVRAITEAADPAEAAARLRSELPQST